MKIIKILLLFISLSLIPTLTNAESRSLPIYNYEFRVRDGYYHSHDSEGRWNGSYSISRSEGRIYTYDTEGNYKGSYSAPYLEYPQVRSAPPTRIPIKVKPNTKRLIITITIY